MKTKDFTSSLLVDASPAEIFDGLKNVRGWWSGLYGEEFEGSSQKVNDEFTFRAGDGMHYSKQKLIELVPGKKLVWLVTESKLSFLKDKSEWTDTKLCFDISKEGDKSRVTFTHVGLVPQIECYNSCAPAWTQYIQEKLKALLAKQRV
jgi:hypothetical protein